MKTTIRQLQGEEIIDALFKLGAYAFEPTPPLPNKDEMLAPERERQGMTCYATCEDDQPVSVAVSTPMTQNMRGKLFPASGVWGVVTDTSARRKGYCRQTMAQLLDAERESGKVFSNLYPFRESFYQRLGYVAFPWTKIAKFQIQSLSPVLKMDLGGEIKLQLVSEAYDAYRDFLKRMRLGTHGMAIFDHGDRVQANRNYYWVAFAIFDGAAEGLMLYKITGEKVSKFTFSAIRFFYQTSRARYLLLNWIARHIDQAENLELWLTEDEYPETWLADMQGKIELSNDHPAMNRVLDVGKIGGMNVGQGSFSAQVIDPLCPWNEGSWHFETHDGVLEVSKSSAAEFSLTIQGISSLIAGTRDPQDIPLNGWGDPDPAHQSILQDMFPRMRPYLHERF